MRPHTLRVVAVLLILLAVLLTGCVVEDPPGNQFTEDLQSDFETEDYFNP